MRTNLISLALIAVVLFSCQKSGPPPPAGNSKNYSVSSSTSNNSSGPFAFSSIEVNPNPIHKGNVAKVIAHANGGHLTYTWSTPHGDLFGTGEAVYYSDSCIGTFQISCTVSDGTNSATITVPVTVID